MLKNITWANANKMVIMLDNYFTPNMQYIELTVYRIEDRKIWRSWLYPEHQEKMHRFINPPIV